MNEIQEKLNQLKEKGWSGAAIADELGVSRRAVEYWISGHRHPENSKPILIVLDMLLERKRIPKRRRYEGTHHLQRKAQHQE